MSQELPRIFCREGRAEARWNIPGASTESDPLSVMEVGVGWFHGRWGNEVRQEHFHVLPRR